MEEKRIVKPWQAGLMLLVGIAVIIVGLLVMKLNNRIVLALDGVIMCLMAWCFGIPYAELQQGIKETVSSMIVAILILLAVGVLVGTWMASGTVPVMIYYGMKVLTPGLFLPVVCILCTLMSTMAGTSWGTLATVGVACMGVAQGLGVPLPAAAGAVCTGAFFGDKVSPLSDSPVIAATVCEVPLMDGIRHALISTGPAYLISLVFYFVYGLRYSGGSVGGEVYEDILSTVSAEFWLSPVLLLPVLVVVVLILMKKPTIPTFIAGIAAGAVWAVIPAIFKAKWNTNETLFTLMMNYIAIQLTSFAVSKWENPPGSNSIGTINSKGDVKYVGWIGNMFSDGYNKDFMWTVIIVLVLAALVYLYLKYTKHGYEIAVVGDSENTARYAGIRVPRIYVRTMALSGALCGFAGFLAVSAVSHTLSTSTAGGRGFTAIIVAWLAKMNPFVMILISALLSFLDKGAVQIASDFGLNEYVSQIISGVILFFILGSEFFINYQVKTGSKHK